MFGTVDISVISQPKLLKFGLQAHFFKMFWNTKFHFSITCTFEDRNLLEELFSDFSCFSLSNIKHFIHGVIVATQEDKKR